MLFDRIMSSWLDWWPSLSQSSSIEWKRSCELVELSSFSTVSRCCGKFLSRMSLMNNHLWRELLLCNCPTNDVILHILFEFFSGVIQSIQTSGIHKSIIHDASMTHGVFPIEMFCCTVKSLKSFWLSKQSSKAAKYWPINWQSWNFETSEFGKCSGESFDPGMVNKVNFLFELFIVESWNAANPFENIVDHFTV